MAPPTAISPKVRSGGKFVRPRRAAGIAKTPYDRPLPTASQTSHVNASNSNWLSRLVLPPTRFIANGAGNFISSIIRPNSASSSDYSSDSGSDCLEDDEDEENKEEELEEYVDANIEQRDAKSSENQLQDVIWSSDTKLGIAKLICQESFSREECDMLKYIIESRVSDFPLEGFGSDVDGSGLRSTAIMEAKRWIEKKKYQPDLNSEMCVTNFFEVQNEGENNINSPVDVAKSYMQTLPPWSSSSVTHIPNSPSTSGFQRLNEQSPLPSISKQGIQSPLSGSWSILEEVRKVRSKATEDLLRTRPSFPMPDDVNDEPRRIAPSQLLSIADNQVEKAMDHLMVEVPTKTCDALIVVPESDSYKYNNGDVSELSEPAINGGTQQKDSKKEAENSTNGHVPTDETSNKQKKLAKTNEETKEKGKKSVRFLRQRKKELQQGKM